MPNMEFVSLQVELRKLQQRFWEQKCLWFRKYYGKLVAMKDKY